MPRSLRCEPHRARLSGRDDKVRKGKPKSTDSSVCATRASETEEHSPFEAQGKQEWLCQEGQEDPESRQDAGATKVGMVRT